MRMRTKIFSLLVAIFLIAQFSQVYAESLWTWSPKDTHHSAIVRIKAGSAGGSGTLISSVFVEGKQRGLVLTAEHVTEGRALADVTFLDGYSTTGRIISSDSGNDVSAIAIFLDKDRTFIPVGKAAPQVGDTLEYCGYGGPADNLRHFLGRIIKYDSTVIDGQTYFLNGDSGGAALYNDSLVGVISGGYNLRSFGLGNWMAHYPGRTCNLRAVSAIVYKVQCSPYNGYCQPQLVPIQRQPQRQPEYFPPDQTRPAPGYPGPIDNSPIQKPEKRPVPPQDPLIFKIGDVEVGDTDVNVEREENVVTFNFTFPPGKTGPQGPAGPVGPKGDKGDKGDPGEIDYNRLKEIIREVINENEDPHEPSWSHLILLAPEDAEYWPRLQNSLFRAQDYYDQIRHSEPPSMVDVGPLPLLVAYSGGKAVRKWVGLREVEDALNSIVRGEYDEFIK